MIDVSTPLKPKFVGCYDDDGYTHDAQCVVYKYVFLHTSLKPALVCRLWSSEYSVASSYQELSKYI